MGKRKQAGEITAGALWSPSVDARLQTKGGNLLRQWGVGIFKRIVGDIKRK